MRVIHVLRKPLSEGTVASNTLTHGVGGLNIDASRIGSGLRLQAAAGGIGDGNIYGSADEYILGRGRDYRVGGRWPANAILQHLDDCRREGTRPAEGYQINRFTDGAKHFGGAAGHPYEVSTMEAGVEAVWACASGCPVGALDAQSGTLRARGNLGSSKGGGGMFGHGLTANDFGGGDTGGASRFFKQVGGGKDA